MAIINKTGITTGGTIQAEHVTRAIDALSGGSTDTIVATGSFTGSFKGVATGSFTGSFKGDGSQLSGVSAGFPFTGSAQVLGTLGITGSFKQHSITAGTLINSFTSDTARIISLEADNINVTASIVTFDPNAALNLSNIYKNGGFRIPVTSPGLSASTGSMYFDIPTTTLYIYDGTQWAYVQLTV